MSPLTQLLNVSTTPTGPPGEPAGVFGSVHNRSVSLTWIPGDNNGYVATSYRVESYNEEEKVWKTQKTSQCPPPLCSAL